MFLLSKQVSEQLNLCCPYAFYARKDLARVNCVSLVKIIAFKKLRNGNEQRPYSLQQLYAFLLFCARLRPVTEILTALIRVLTLPGGYFTANRRNFFRNREKNFDLFIPINKKMGTIKKYLIKVRKSVLLE